MTETTARVRTDRPERYLKQLASHMGHKVPVVLEGRSAEVRFGFATAVLTATKAHLLMQVSAATDADARRAAEVLGSHLLRFATADELTVTWEQPAATLAG